MIAGSTTLSSSNGLLAARLKQVPEIKSLWDGVEKMCMGSRITIQAVSEKSQLAPFGASFEVQWIRSPIDGFLLTSPKIYYLESLSEDFSLLFVLFEICNLSFIEQYLNLDLKVQKISEKKYVQLNYEIEKEKVNQLYHSYVQKLYEENVLPRDVYLKPFDSKQKEDHRQKFIDRYRFLKKENERSSKLMSFLHWLFTYSAL